MLADGSMPADKDGDSWAAKSMCCAASCTLTTLMWRVPIKPPSGPSTLRPPTMPSVRGLAWVYLGAGLFLADGKQQALAELAEPRQRSG